MQQWLKPVTPEDLNQLASLIVQYYQDDPCGMLPEQATAEQMAARMVQHPHLVSPLLLFHENACVGYALLVYYFSNEYGGVILWLDEFFIRRELRSRGLGGAFLSLIRGWAEARGIPRIELEVNEHNEGARQLYLRHGFEESGRRLLGLNLVPSPQDRQSG
jgi:GNAT superfamily N-acetyltransferase